jgi:hypothetical protein
MRENVTLVKKVVSANSNFITSAVRTKAIHTSSTVRQVNTSFSPECTPASSISASMGVPMISIIHHPTVAHETFISKSHDGSSTGTVDYMVDYVQAIYFDPFNVSLGTKYNRTMIEEINVNWDVESLTSPVLVSAPAHVVSSLCTTST